MYIGGFLKWWYPTTIGFNTHMGSCQNPVMVDEYSIRSYEGTFISLHYPRRKTKNSLFQCLGRTIYVHTYVQIIVFHSKGNVGYPWECTLAVVPPILPHIALYNHCIINIYVVYVGIYLGYSPKGTQLFPLIHAIFSFLLEIPFSTDPLNISMFLEAKSMGDLPSVIKQSGQVQFSSSVSGFPQDDLKKSENSQNVDLQRSCFLPRFWIFLILEMVSFFLLCNYWKHETVQTLICFFLELEVKICLWLFWGK